MVIIAKMFVNVFASKHPASKTALNNWYQIVKEVDWENFNDVRNTFGSVDEYAMIFFDKRTVYIRFIGTHAEYDKLKDCSKI